MAVSRHFKLLAPLDALRWTTGDRGSGWLSVGMISDPLVPKDATFLGQQEFQLRVSPLRRALLVRHGDDEQARRAFQAAAAIWGGARCPVLPLREDGTVDSGWVALAELMGVSEVVDFTSSQRGQSRWVDEESARFHLRPAPGLEDAEYWNPHPLATAAAERSAVRELYVPADTSLLSLAGAGGYGLAEQVKLFRVHGWSVVENADALQVARHQISKRTALWATTIGDVDTEVANSMMSTMALLWVTDAPDSFDDAVWFWNARVVRPRASFGSGLDVYASLEVANSPDFREDFAAALAPQVASTPGLVISSHTVDADQLKRLGLSLGATEFTGTRFTETWGRPTTPRPLEFRVNLDPQSWWMVPRKSGRVAREVVTLRRPTTEISFDSPQPWQASLLASGYVNVSWTSPSVDGPRKQAVATLYHRDADWVGDSLRVKSLNLLTYAHHIALPGPDEVLHAAVRESGTTFERSDKGQQLVGAVNRDPDMEFYRETAVIHAIRQLTAKVGRDLAREMAALRAAGTVSDTALERLRATSLLGSRPARSLSQVKTGAAKAGADPDNVAPALDDLVRRGAAEMGLVTRCALCSLTDFRPLSSVGAGAVCSGCGSDATFSRTGGGSPEVHYRLSSLTHTVSLNGGLAPLAAFAVLVGENAYVDPGVNLFRKGETIGEVDLLGWQGQSLFAAEAKMSAAGFASADIARDVELAADLGADTFVAVCLEDLDDSLRAEIASHTQRHNLLLRVLDRPALVV